MYVARQARPPLRSNIRSNQSGPGQARQAVKYPVKSHGAGQTPGQICAARQAIAKGLKKNTNMRTLYLCENEINSAGIKSLESAKNVSAILKKMLFLRHEKQDYSGFDYSFW